ncbi:uncharacterized protein LOC136075202 [Hydra vulgaris]|uniref:Uncharacterized protein LOC136075202 n=1 Tax=Hydra vulgaris TaxID=6087 RepID=A0ABM4B4J1_HYDVU
MPLERNCATALCNQSLEFWKKRHSRADNISTVVLFFDEEFGSCDPLYYDSENITLSLEDGEDTPPLFDTLPPVLVRSLDIQEIPPSVHFPVKILSGSSQKKNYNRKCKHEEDHKGTLYRTCYTSLLYYIVIRFQFMNLKMWIMLLFCSLFWNPFAQR